MSELWVTPEELGQYANSEFSYEAAKAASNIMWALSGRRYTGETTVTERYVCSYRAFRLGPSARTFNATLLDGDVYNIPKEEFNDFAELTSDGLSPTSRIRLRGRPVTKIHAIRTRAGKIIPPHTYYLVDHSTIQAAAGVPWTPCNIEVTYSYGSPVPTMGKMAARTLAIEFAKLWTGDDDCQLPQRITSITRQGVSYTLLDSQDFLDELKTGIYAIDLFLRSVNPDKARAKARVFTPDIPRARRYTPKGPKIGTSPLDIVVPGNGNGILQTSFEYLYADFLYDEGWTNTITLRNYSESRSIDLGPEAVTINQETGDIMISISYDDALSVLGLVEPGTWDMFSTRPDLEDPTQIETIYVASGNLRINLVDTPPQTPYTVGN
jgi:hypothetical protein